MYPKCCVPGCNSLRPDVTLHKFPRCEKRLNKWLASIDSRHLWNLSLREIRKLLVCREHFENKHVTKKSRLSNIAYPTLILPDEVKSGQPMNSKRPSSAPSPCLDHQYAKNSHWDHTYCMPPGLEPILRGYRLALSSTTVVYSRTTYARYNAQHRLLPDPTLFDVGMQRLNELGVRYVFTLITYVVFYYMGSLVAKQFYVTWPSACGDAHHY